jgi:hypothetical protein
MQSVHLLGGSFEKEISAVIRHLSDFIRVQMPFSGSSI